MSTRPFRAMTKRAQRGFAIGYLVTAIALLSVIAYVASQMADVNAELRWTSATTDVLHDQVLLIRRQVIACGTAYPGGVNSDPSSLAHYKKYPAGNASLASIVCPGAPLAESAVWSGRDGIFLRKLPAEFTAWSYRNDADGLTVATRATSDRAQNVITRLAGRLGAAEASVNGDTFTFVVAAP